MEEKVLVMVPHLDSPENGIVKTYQIYEVPLSSLNEAAFTANAKDADSAIGVIQGYSRAARNRPQG